MKSQSEIIRSFAQRMVWTVADALKTEGKVWTKPVVLLSCMTCMLFEYKDTDWREELESELRKAFAFHNGVADDTYSAVVSDRDIEGVIDDCCKYQ